MGWIRHVRCEKLQRDFVARTYVLVAPVQYVLQQLSCTYEMIPNAPKYYELHQNISLGSNGVGLVCSLQKNPNVTSLHKIPMWLRVTNFCINCTSSVCFASSFMQLRNNPKCTEILWNRLKNYIGVQHWVRSLRKIPTSLRGTNFCINCTSSPRFAPSFM